MSNITIFKSFEKDINNQNHIWNTENKNKFGEVFTPNVLVEELLKFIPVSVWRNPNLKWLEPSAGNGSIASVIYKKLMSFLNKEIPNIKERHNHIITKMIYCVELNPKNVYELKKTFGIHANIYQGDFLSELPKTFPEKFDVIIGNPPFNNEKSENRKGGYGGNTLWDKFLIKCMNLLSPLGFLSFISPQLWRKPFHPLWNLLVRQNHLQYLHIYDRKKGQKYFNLDLKFDLYTVQKALPNHSIILDEKNTFYKLNLKDKQFLPNYNITKIYSYLTTKSENSIRVIYYSSRFDSRKLSEKKTQKFKYPVIHGLSKNHVKVLYSDNFEKQHQHPKVILTKGRNQYPLLDFKGKYGMSQNIFGILIENKKEGDVIMNATEKYDFKNLIDATKWATYETDWKMFLLFRKDFWFDLHP